MSFFRSILYTSALVAQCAYAGPNAGVEIGFAPLSKPCGLKAGDRIEFIIVARNMEAVRQIKFDFSWHPLGAITAAVGSTADATEAEFFIAPGPPQIEGDLASYGMAVFGGEGLAGEGNIALIGFELSSDIKPDTPLAIYIDAVSLGPSFTERDTIYPIEAAILGNYCDAADRPLNRGFYLDATATNAIYSMAPSAPVADGSSGEIFLTARNLENGVFRAGQLFTWTIDNAGPGTLYAQDRETTLPIEPAARAEITSFSDHRGSAHILLDAHSGPNNGVTAATIEVCSGPAENPTCSTTEVTWNEPTTAVMDYDSSTPQRAQLEANFPNPFNASTVIPFVLAKAENGVQLDIFNMQGQQLRSFALGSPRPGHYNIHWDGRSATGVPVASGVYFYRLRTNSAEYVHSMLLIR